MSGYRNFYVPRTKQDLVEWLSKHLAAVTKSSLTKMDKGQLLGMYYRVRTRE